MKDPRGLVSRLVAERFTQALELSRVVLLEGARGSGKSTVLSMLQSSGELVSIIDLSPGTVRRAAADDPLGFVEALTAPLAIDEVQLVPDLALAVKALHDRDPAWGPAILTGSSPVARGQLGGSDPLVGRALRLRLRPLSHRELAGRADDLLPALADPGFSEFDRGVLDRSGYVELARRSGFPAARELSPAAATEWFRGTYVDGVLPRSLADDRRRTDRQILTRVLRTLAASPSAELNVAALARSLEIARDTVSAHVALLEDLGLIDTVPGWRPGAAKRHVSRPKVHPADGAISGWAIGAHPTDTELGGLIESMVYRELAAQVDASFGAAELFHWRSGRHEVDLVLAFDDQLVPIEVKLSRSVPPRALSGIDAFAEAFSRQFLRGIVFYAGDDVVPLGRNRLAVPISALWTTPRP